MNEVLPVLGSKMSTKTNIEVRRLKKYLFLFYFYDTSRNNKR